VVSAVRASLDQAPGREGERSQQPPQHWLPWGWKAWRVALFWQSLPFALLKVCLTGPEDYLPLAVLPIAIWVMADWQDLYGEMPQGSSSTSHPREKLPKGDMENQSPLTADELDCGHSHTEAGIFPGTLRVMQPCVSPRPWSE